MAAPGIGVGDIVLACQTIIDICQKYRDAPDELNEIASKARSLEVTLQRIKDENLYKGSIIKRAENAAEAQVQSILQPLHTDVEELERIVEKYQDIHANGYGRRLLFALTQSGDLADLRRKIGLHEQALQLWYMTVIVSSLRRIEDGVEGLREILNAMRKWSPREEKKVREQVARRACSRTQSRVSSRPSHTASRLEAEFGHNQRISSKISSKPEAVTEEDVEPLKEALEQSGVSKAAIDANLEDAIKYLFADSERKREEIEKKAKEEAEEKNRRQENRYDDFARQEEQRRKREKEEDLRREEEYLSMRKKEEAMRRELEKQKLYEAKAREERKPQLDKPKAPRVSRETATSYRTAPPSYYTVEHSRGPSIRIHHEDPLPDRKPYTSNLHRSRSARESKKVSFEDELYVPVSRPRASSGSRLEPYNHEQPSLYIDTAPYNEYTKLDNIFQYDEYVDTDDMFDRRSISGRGSDPRRYSDHELRVSPRLSPVLAERPRQSSRHLSVSDSDTYAVRRVERSVSPSPSVTRYIIKE